MTGSKKRKPDSSNDNGNAKRLKISTADGHTHVVKLAQPEKPTSPAIEDPPAESVANAPAKKKTKGPTPATESAPAKPQRRINKLVPPRPFPTVPTSVSATGPRSAHTEGKNYICITRKTRLGVYLRRCKNAIIADGYKTLHLHAMGAAIPHLALLAVALPPILPFAADEIRTDIETGSVEVQDEVIPDDEDEDVSYQTRGKSTLRVVLRIGDGEFEGDRMGKAGGNGGGSVGGGKAKRGTGNRKGKGKGKAAEEPQQTVYQEPEQDDMAIG